MAYLLIAIVIGPVVCTPVVVWLLVRSPSLSDCQDADRCRWWQQMVRRKNTSSNPKSNDGQAA